MGSYFIVYIFITETDYRWIQNPIAENIKIMQFTFFVFKLFSEKSPVQIFSTFLFNFNGDVYVWLSSIQPSLILFKRVQPCFCTKHTCLCFFRQSENNVLKVSLSQKKTKMSN